MVVNFRKESIGNVKVYPFSTLCEIRVKFGQIKFKFFTNFIIFRHFSFNVESVKNFREKIFRQKFRNWCFSYNFYFLTKFKKFSITRETFGINFRNRSEKQKMSVFTFVKISLFANVAGGDEAGWIYYNVLNEQKNVFS